jgi:hypothetical protein
MDQASVLSATAANASGGDISVVASSFSMLDGTAVTTQCGGPGGRVVITATAGGIRVGGNSLVSAQSASSGNIQLSATGPIDLTGGIITAQTPGAGGAVSIMSTRSNLILDNTTVSAEAGADGNINLAAESLMLIRSSRVTARARTTGGQIQLDPPYVILDRSIIDGRAGTRDVVVSVAADAVFLKSGESSILSNNVFLPPTPDVAGSLIALPATLPQSALGFAPVCAPRLEQSFSSFVITGLSGRPPQPAGWLPDLDPVEGMGQPRE